MDHLSALRLRVIQSAFVWNIKIGSGNSPGPTRFFFKRESATPQLPFSLMCSTSLFSFHCIINNFLRPFIFADILFFIFFLCFQNKKIPLSIQSLKGSYTTWILKKIKNRQNKCTCFPRIDDDSADQLQMFCRALNDSSQIQLLDKLLISGAVLMVPAKFTALPDISFLFTFMISFRKDSSASWNKRTSFLSTVHPG